MLKFTPQSTRRTETSAKANPVWIASPLQIRISGMTFKISTDFLDQKYICLKIFIKIRSVIPEMWMWDKLWKMLILQCCWEFFRKKFLDPDLEADGFRNLISLSLSTNTTSLVYFSWRSDQWFLREVANRQTDESRL